MKRMIAGVLAIAATAAVSQAAVIFTVTDAGAAGAFERFDVKITGLNGADATAVSGRASIGTMTGTFQVVTNTGAVGSGNTMSFPGTASNWKTKTLGQAVNGDGGDFPTPQSFVNFDTFVTDANTARTPGALANTVTGTWAITNGDPYRLGTNNTNPAGDASVDNSLLGSVFVTPGTYFMFTGQVGDYGSTGTNVTFNNLVPEPASLSLLGLGALGLVARRRRA